MSYFVRIGPGPYQGEVDPVLRYVFGGTAFTPTIFVAIQSTSNISNLDDNGQRFICRRVNDANGARVPNLYVLTSLRWTYNGTYPSYNLRFDPSPTTNPNRIVNANSESAAPDAEFSVNDPTNVIFFYVEPFTNTTTTTVAIPQYEEKTVKVRPCSLPTEVLYIDSVVSQLLKVSTTPPPLLGHDILFTSSAIKDGPVIASPSADTNYNFYYSIRSVAKIDTQFFYLTMYNDMGPDGPLENWEFEKGDFASAMLFRFLPRKKKGVSGSTVNTYDVQCKTTGLYLQQYRFTTRAADGSLVEHFAVSRTDTSDMETEMEIVQGDPNVLGAFKVRSYAYSNATREVFLRFDPSDPWTVHATTEQYNEATDGFEIFLRACESA